MAEVILSLRAAQDLEGIGDYLDQFNPRASKEMVQRILDACGRLETFPLSGRAGRIAETRELVVPGTAYLVPYRVRAERIEILAIFHAAREFPEEM